MARMKFGVLLGITTVLALASAGCDTEIAATDYDTSCSADTDCVNVTVGDICKCSCEAGAINKKDQTSYDEDRLTIACGAVCSSCPPYADPVCRANICSAQ